MQGISRSDRDLWDAGDVTGHLVQPGSVFAFLAAHRTELFPDEFIAGLFTSPTGLPSLPACWSGACWCSRSCMTCPTRRPRTR